METSRVFLVRTSLEETRPEISFENPVNYKKIDWLLIGEVLAGKADISQYRPPHLVVPEADALDWDFYRCSGLLGLFSQRAANSLSPFASQCFSFHEAYINEQPYKLLGLVGTIDVLDREHTLGEMFPHDRTRFMRFDKYAFHKDKITDPCLFTIPEAKVCIFGTDSIDHTIREHKLRGFRLVDAEAGIHNPL